MRDLLLADRTALADHELSSAWCLLTTLGDCDPHYVAPIELTATLQACANAEAAYTRTLTAASKVKLVGDCDGASVRGALDGFSDLPFMIGQVILAELLVDLAPQHSLKQSW